MNRNRNSRRAVDLARSIAVLIALPSLALASEGPPADFSGTSARRDPGRVCWSDDERGGLWVRGATYKAAFEPDQASYIPFLGSDAPRNFPVAFRIAHVSAGGEAIAFDPLAAPAREGEAVVYDRGSLVERYEIGLESIEQTFVFDDLPRRGELVVRLSVESELSPLETGGALHLENSLGGVRYGRATALDARGRNAAAATTWTGSGIEIRVPADFVESASLPLVIDPIVSTFGVDTGAADDYDPDVAYDPGTDRWLAVYEEVFSASDRDVVATLLNGSGALIVSGLVDFSIDDSWAHPAVAVLASAGKFLIAAEVRLSTGGPRKIRVRSYDASTAVLGPANEISVGSSDDNYHPDVGGNASSDSGYFTVVWVHDGGQRIHVRGVTSAGLPSSSTVTEILNSSPDSQTHPSISKSSTGGHWAIVWERRMSATDRDVVGVLHDPQGYSSTFPIEATSADTTSPSVSSPLDGSPEYLVAYERRSSTGDRDIEVARVTSSLQIYYTNLTSAEHLSGAGNLALDQVQPSVDTDGTSFVVAYSQHAANQPASPYGVRASTLPPVGLTLRLAERCVALSSGSGTSQHSVEIAAGRGTGAPRRHLAVWVATATSHPPSADILGALYDASQFASFCDPASPFTTDCPCGVQPTLWMTGCPNSVNTSGATLAGSGVASISADTMVLTASGERPSALSIFVQGTALLSADAVYGQGMRCVGGQLERLYTKSASGGVATAPTGTELEVHRRSNQLGDPLAPGSTRYYFTYYRDPVVLGSCQPSSTFNTTQALQVRWAP